MTKINQIQTHSSSRSMVNTNTKNGKQLRKPKETTQVPNTRPTIRREKQSKPILSSNPTSTIPNVGNKFKFLNVHGIMNTSGLLES